MQTRVPQALHEAAFKECNEKYAEAMRGVYERFPGDLDVVALYADSIVCLSAWDLWDLKTGKHLSSITRESTELMSNFLYR